MALTDIFSPAQRRSIPSPFHLLRTRLAVWRSRRALARLDARELADIGLSRAAADHEAAKGPWDVPPSWAIR